MRNLLLAVLAVLIACSAVADVTLDEVFGSHMVLQSGEPIVLWGTADPGEEVNIAFRKQTTGTEADANGNWRVVLEAEEPGGPDVLTVNEMKVEDVLVGQVWVCSGQSNMQWSVRRSANPAEEIRNATYPKIRIYSVPRRPAFEPGDDAGGEWQAVTPESIPNFSAVAYAFGRHLQGELGQPIGLIHTSWGGTPVEAWMPIDAMANAGLPDLAKSSRDRIAKQKAAADAVTATRPSEPIKINPRQPSVLYNGMVAPLAGLSVKGFIWYQGESNAGRSHQYAPLLSAMIEQWRTDLGGKDHAFLIVQLANFRERQTDAAGKPGWALLRQAQQDVADTIDGADMSVTIDIGDAKDIHPKNKQDVGKRLALLALKNTYGKDVVAYGPTVTAAELKDGSVALTLDHAEGVELRGSAEEQGQTFAVGNAAGEFVWATPELDGTTLMLSFEGLEKPTVVRYAWQNNPPSVLYNAAGLPAAPFSVELD